MMCAFLFSEYQNKILLFGINVVSLQQITPQRVYIRFVGSHSEYDKITDIQHI